jgi:hypothetical protein
VREVDGCLRDCTVLVVVVEIRDGRIRRPIEPAMCIVL